MVKAYAYTEPTGRMILNHVRRAERDNGKMRQRRRSYRGAPSGAQQTLMIALTGTPTPDGQWPAHYDYVQVRWNEGTLKYIPLSGGFSSGDAQYLPAINVLETATGFGSTVGPLGVSLASDVATIDVKRLPNGIGFEVVRLEQVDDGKLRPIISEVNGLIVECNTP